VVDGYVAALADIFERDGASDSCRAAGYGGGFGREEVVRHGSGGGEIGWSRELDVGLW